MIAEPLPDHRVFRILADIEGIYFNKNLEPNVLEFYGYIRFLVIQE